MSAAFTSGTLAPRPAVDPIDRYVAGLAGALRGPRKVRADLVAEARDSLTDAAEAFREAGLDEHAAQARAVREFGTYAEVVPGYQAELAVAQGRRTALLIALALPTVQQLAPLMWWHSPYTSHVTASPYYYRLAEGFDYLALGGGLVAALAVIAFGWGSRYLRDGVGLTPVVGRGALAFLAVHGLAGALLYAWSLSQWPGFSHWPPMWIGGVLLWASFLYAGVCAWRCLATARRDAALSRRPAAA